MRNRHVSLLAALSFSVLISPLIMFPQVTYAANQTQIHLATPAIEIGPDGLPIPQGSGTLSMVIPDTSYRANSPKQGKMTLSNIWCEFNNSGAGVTQPTLAIDGWNGGISFQAIFTAKTTTLHLATEATIFTGGPVATFADHNSSGQLEKFPTHVAGSVNLFFRLAQAGSLTVDVTCVRPSEAKAATLPTGAASQSTSQLPKGGSTPLLPILAVILIIVAISAVAFKMKSKRPKDWTDGITDDPEGIMPDSYSHENWMRIFNRVRTRPPPKEVEGGFNPVPPSSTPTADDPTDREEIG